MDDANQALIHWWCSSLSDVPPGFDTNPNPATGLNIPGLLLLQLLLLESHCQQIQHLFCQVCFQEGEGRSSASA
jgi:hypothetical protein